ncbi:MAG: hypothetical protein Q8M26_01615 [Pseudolabrys sp.]|nr:hypothetical protein [Pseudolabrys sp.]
MCTAENYLEDARKSFCLAKLATGTREADRFAAMGRDYLQLAHRAAELATVPREQSFWRLP